MAFHSTCNFRDVGACVNTSAALPRLQPRLFYRSGLPDEAMPTERARLIEEFEIRTVIDLRTDTERNDQMRRRAGEISLARPDLVAQDADSALQVSGVAYRCISLNGHAYSVALLRQLSYWNLAKFGTLYALGWRHEAVAILCSTVMASRGLIGLAQDSLVHSTVEVKAVFDVLSDTRAWPLLVHCTQGKDRTGLVVLLVLLLLEVPLEDISADYQASERELLPGREARLEQLRSIGLPDEFADCAEGWTRAVAHWLETRYGGVRYYLKGCGISREQQARVRSILEAAPQVYTTEQ